LLGVLPTSDDRTIKTRFRRLAALHHPDKVQSLNTESEKADADTFFMDLKLAQDTLLDSTKRFAYLRFGKSVVENTKATSIRGFLYHGLLTLLPQYGGGLFVMILLNMFWFSAWGRYVCAFLALCFEEMKQRMGC
jgi:DnaJ-class molecular chaperone